MVRERPGNPTLGDELIRSLQDALDHAEGRPVAVRVTKFDDRVVDERRMRAIERE
jgi:hypothetical protein